MSQANHKKNIWLHMVLCLLVCIKYDFELNMNLSFKQIFTGCALDSGKTPMNPCQSLWFLAPAG